MKIGIIGLGWIAERLAETISQMEEVTLYAVGSRNLDKAINFSNKFNSTKYYGAYEELVRDDEIDLVYIATPHSEHYENIKLCLNNNKNVLCEKAFTINSVQAKEVIELAKEKKLLLAEAIWTRYMPSINLIKKEILNLGKIEMIDCNLCYKNSHIERLHNPNLAGGSLLDLGVYTLNFAFAFLGDDYNKISSSVKMTNNNVDECSTILIEYNDAKAVLFNSMSSNSNRKGVISCEHGFIEVSNITNPNSIEVYDYGYNLIKKVEIPKQITGYEYQLISCMNTLQNSNIECVEMTHKNILYVMKTMDKLRSQWGMKYPGEN